MKKLICLLLAALLLVSCAACSGTGSGKDELGDTQAVRPSQQTQETRDAGDPRPPETVNDPVSGEDGGWYLEDTEINGWRFKVIHDPDYEFEYPYHGPELSRADVAVTIDGKEETVNMLQSPFNFTYDEFVEKMKGVGYFDGDAKIYPYSFEDIRYYDTSNYCASEYTRGFLVKETENDAFIQKGTLGVNGISKLGIVLYHDAGPVSQDYAYTVMKGLVGEELAEVLVYYSKESDVADDDLEDQMSAKHSIDCGGGSYKLERSVNVLGDNSVWKAEFYVSVDGFFPNDENKSLLQEYTKEETGDVPYKDTKFNLFRETGIEDFESPMGKDNLKRYFEFTHTGSDDARLGFFTYRDEQKWGRHSHDPDEHSFSLSCQYENTPRIDGYTQSYVMINSYVQCDTDDNPTYFSFSGSMYDAFRAENSEVGSDAWNAERDAVYQEFCENGAKFFSAMLNTDVELDYSNFEANGERRSYKSSTESDILLEKDDYYISVELNYSQDSSSGNCYWYGNFSFG